MLVQMNGFKVKNALESIIKDKELLNTIHGYEKSEKIVARAQRMLDLLTSSYALYNVANNDVHLDPDDHAFIKEYAV